MEKILEQIMSTEIFASAVVVLLAVVVMAILEKICRGYIKRNDPDHRVMSMIRSVLRTIRVLVGILVVFAILQINGVNISSMVAGVGVAGALVGLAMQDIFKDLIMGLHIVSDKAFKYGDVVIINDVEGIVTSFTLLTTQLKDVNSGNLVTICNRNISATSVVCGIYDIDLPLRYDEDPEDVKKILTRAAEAIDRIQDVEYCQYMGVQRFDSSAVIYKIRFKCSPAEKWPVWRKAMTELQKVVVDTGLEIPFQQIDVHNI